MRHRLIQLGAILLIGLAMLSRSERARADEPGECTEFYNWVGEHCTGVRAMGCSCPGGGGYCEGWYEGEDGTSGSVYCS